MTEVALPPSGPRDDVAFRALLAKIARERGFVCGSYKDRCLRRRVAVRMRANGVHTYEDYAKVLDTVATEYERLLDALTINVTRLFRNWEVFAALADSTIPALWSQPGEIRVWSAGCASGEEAYSLAILFHRHAEQVGEIGRLTRVRIYASDIDGRSLDAAARGAYADAAFADTPAELRRRYFSNESPSMVLPAVRQLIRFERRDLLRDAPPPACHMIVCRNVLIYFDRETQEALFERFCETLVPGGWLVLGKVETLLGAARSNFTAVNTRERIFRRS